MMIMGAEKWVEEADNIQKQFRAGEISREQAITLFKRLGLSEGDSSKYLRHKVGGNN